MNSLESPQQGDSNEYTYTTQYILMVKEDRFPKISLFLNVCFLKVFKEFQAALKQILISHNIILYVYFRLHGILK